MTTPLQATHGVKRQKVTVTVFYALTFEAMKYTPELVKHHNYRDVVLRYNGTEQVFYAVATVIIGNHFNRRATTVLWYHVIWAEAQGNIVFLVGFTVGSKNTHPQNMNQPCLVTQSAIYKR